MTTTSVSRSRLASSRGPGAVTATGPSRLTRTAARSRSAAVGPSPAAETTWTGAAAAAGGRRRARAAAAAPARDGADERLALALALRGGLEQACRAAAGPRGSGAGPRRGRRARRRRGGPRCRGRSASGRSGSRRRDHGDVGAAARGEAGQLAGLLGGRRARQEQDRGGELAAGAAQATAEDAAHAEAVGDRSRPWRPAPCASSRASSRVATRWIRAPAMSASSSPKPTIVTRTSSDQRWVARSTAIDMATSRATVASPPRATRPGAISRSTRRS